MPVGFDVRVAAFAAQHDCLLLLGLQPRYGGKPLKL